MREQSLTNLVSIELFYWREKQLHCVFNTIDSTIYTFINKFGKDATV